MLNCGNFVNKIIDIFFCVLERDLIKEYDDFDSKIDEAALRSFRRSPRFVNLPMLTTEMVHVARLTNTTQFRAVRAAQLVQTLPLLSDSLCEEERKGD